MRSVGRVAVAFTFGGAAELPQVIQHDAEHAAHQKHQRPKQVDVRNGLRCRLNDLAEHENEKQVHHDAHVSRHVIEHRHHPGALSGGKVAQAARSEMNRAGESLAHVRHNQEDRAGQSLRTKQDPQGVGTSPPVGHTGGIEVRRNAPREPGKIGLDQEVRINHHHERDELEHERYPLPLSYYFRRIQENLRESPR